MTETELAPPPETPAYRKSVLRDYAETILVCVLFVIFSRSFIFQQSKIPSGSMMDTLLIGDYIMVNRFVYGAHSFEWEKKLMPVRPIRRGDVVVFKQPEVPEKDYIKRVVGLPGDTVELRNGFLMVNGKPLPEPYVQDEYRVADRMKNLGPVEVLPDHFFVLGDHRDQSADSRFWGQVPRDLMKGRALLIWLSFDEIERDENGEEKKPNPYPSFGERMHAWRVKITEPHRWRFRRIFRLIR